MPQEFVSFDVEIDDTLAAVMDGVRRGYVYEDRQSIIQRLKTEADAAYAAGDDDDFADGIKHAYMLIEKMEEA
jgi:hypothetical protein